MQEAINGLFPGNRSACYRQSGRRAERREKTGRNGARGAGAFGFRLPALLLPGLFLLVLLAGMAAPTAAQAARITGLSVLAEGKSAHVIIDLDAAFPAPELFYLDGPQRIVVDLPGTQVTASQRAQGIGPVASVRLAQNTPQVSRLVIDLAEAAVASLDPAGAPGRNAVRLVVQADRQGYAAALRQGRRTLAAATPPAAQSAPAAPAAAPAAAAPSAPAAAPPLSPAALPVVVIDAGHGGQDPGAPSILKGRWEKEVTLAISKAIKAELDRSGKVKAVLTRSTDIFIPLGRRVEIAREAGANLFISIHADSIGRPDVHGATVYTLSETASDKEAERLAAKENKADIIAGINLGAESQDVTDILIDLVQRETKNLSAEFAGIVVREVGKHRYFRSNNHRFAGFRVLKAPDVPSVLLETGYMSNLEDSKYLFSEAGQRAIARGVRAAVEAYFERHLARTAVAAGAP